MESVLYPVFQKMPDDIVLKTINGIATIIITMADMKIQAQMEAVVAVTHPYVKVQGETLERVRSNIIYVCAK
jgi:hypothetical protein